LERILERFAHAWQRGERPALEDYLVCAGEGERRALLIELVHEDLEYRVKGGEAVRVEAYLERFPELRAERSVALDLIAAEYALRRRDEPALPTEEYLRRFPEFGEGLLPHLDQYAQRREPAEPGFAAAEAQDTLLPSREPVARANGETPTPISFGTPGAAGAAEGLTIPGYEILGELGRGGMGVVYKARQIALNRLVALKMVLAGGHASAADLARFRREAEAVARLQHPHIVQIYEVGEADGRPFFSLEFVEGGSLEQKLHGTPLPQRQAAELVEVLARAVQAAHERSIIHRDLKPANVLLTKDGQPKITDFGLAKQTDSEKGQTQSGAIVGTPSYMAPEQAGGKSTPIGPPADVYALGAILYEVLTGRPPFRAATPLDTVLLVLAEEPVRPRRLQPQVPRDLETICLTCLRKEPHRRYPSAASLAGDLQAFREGRPITARPVGRFGQAWRWCRRNRALAAALLAVALTLVAGSVVATLFGVQARASAERAEEEANRARRERQEAETARTKEARQRKAAEDLTDQKRRQLARFQVAGGTRLLHDGDLAAALPWFAAALKTDVPERRATHRTRCLSVWRGTPRPYLLWRHGDSVSQLVVSPDGRRAASGSADGTVQVWDLVEGKPFAGPFKLDSPVMSVALSPDGRRVAAGGGAFGLSGEVRVWEVETGRPVGGPIKAPGVVFYVTFLGDGRKLFGGSYNLMANLAVGGPDKNRSRLHVWPVGGDKEERGWTFPLQVGVGPFPTTLACVIHAPTGRVLVADGRQATIRDAATRKVLVGPVKHGHEIYFARLSADGRRAVTASREGRCKVWDAVTGKDLLPEISHRNAIKDVGFDERGRVHLAFWQGSVQTFEPKSVPIETRSERTQNDQLGPKDWVPHFTPDGRFVAGAADDGTARLWEVGSRQPASPVLRHSSAITWTASADAGRRLVTGCSDGTVRVWDLALGNQPAWTREQYLPSVQVLANGRAVAFGKGRALFFDPATGNRTDSTKWEVKEKEVRACALDRDRLRLAVGTTTGEARVWDAATGKPLTPPLKHDRPAVMDAAFSPDGRLLATRAALGDQPPLSFLSEVHVWEAATGRRLLRQPIRISRPDALLGAILCFAFSPDGRHLAAGGGVITKRVRGEVQIFEAATGRPAGPALAVADGLVPLRVAFSPDGKWLAAASAFGDSKVGEIRVWEAATGRPALEPRRFSGDVQVGFYPSGRRLWTMIGNQVQVWEMRDGKPAFPAIRHAAPVRLATLSPGGRFLVTATGSEAFLWDAATGEPLGPPLQGPDNVQSVALSSDGKRVLLGCAKGQVRCWELGQARYDPADLPRMARVVSCQEMEGVVGRPVAVRVLAADWAALRAKYPEDFRPDEDQVFRWHDGQASACISDRQWAASLPHLGRLVARYPDSAWLRYVTATACVGADDRTGLREQCAEMLRHFAKTDNLYFVDWTVKSCLILPGVVADLAPAHRLAKLLEAAKPADAAYPWFMLSRGIAAYREEKMDEAERWIEKARGAKNKARYCGITSDLFLAMVRHKQGRPEEAGKLLAGAVRAVREAEKQPPDGSWVDPIHCRAVLAEARALLGTR
jgi:WD40 repeat protein